MPRRAESLASFALLGLILSIALAGEMLRLSVKPDAAAAWFLFASLVLFGAQIFSDILGRAVALRSEATARDLMGIGRHDLPILIGPFGFAALLIGAHIFNVEADNALIGAIATGLLIVGALAYYAAAAYRTWRRALLSMSVVVFCVLIVIAENVV